MYKIIGEKKSHQLYDESINSIFDQSFNRINLRKLDSCKPFIKISNDKQVKFYDSLEKNISLSDGSYYPYNEKLTDITIQLGQNCNYKCIYCCQNYCKPDEPSHSDVQSFLKRLKNSAINQNNVSTVQLWGGEPFVYWKSFKQIVEFIRNEIPEFRGYFHTTTNAALLTKDKVDFILKYGVRLQVSHDGVNHKLQRDEVDQVDNDEIRSNVLALLRDHHVGDINVTFAPMFNPNLLDTLEFFEEKLPGVPICCRSALRCDSTNKHLLNLFTAENIRIARESYYKVITLKPGDRFFEMTRPTRYRLYTLCRNFIFGRSPASIDFNCPSMQRHAMCFNLKGNFIPCHGSTEAMNHGVGNLDDVKSCHCTGFTSVSKRHMCKGCLYTQICQGPCGMYNDIDAKIHCQSTKWAQEAQFSGIQKTIFDERPVKIERVEYDLPSL